MAGQSSSTFGNDTVTATQFAGQADGEGFPPGEAWESTPAIRFQHDWQGKNAEPELQTEVRVLWAPETLYFRIVARYRIITVFDDAEPSGWRDHLWDRDVAEVFLQPAGSDRRRYKEFEVSPNGLWIDLDIAPRERHDLKSGLKRRVRVDQKSKRWTAELALPMECLTAEFSPDVAWRANFFRVEGPNEPRFYSAWQPTGTPAPNFHVPAAFGKLAFRRR